MPDTTRREDAKPEARERKPYTPPTVTEYGSVAKLTMTKGTTQVEISPNKKTACL